jgi:hypothetical protein
MGSASKGKRVASGPIGGKAKHARIGMSYIQPDYPSTRSRMSPRIRGARAGQRVRRSREVRKELIIESPPTSELKDDEEEFYSDDLGDDETRSTSPSKLTARQRAKGNKDLQETLVSLPGASYTSPRPCSLTKQKREPKKL